MNITSPITIEIDLNSIQKGVHESDIGCVPFDENWVDLFSPEGRAL